MQCVHQSKVCSVGEQCKLLAIFDFDHTLVDGNTDTWITKMLPSTMQIIREHQQNGWCWTNIMDKVFGILHEGNISKDDYVRCFESLQFTEGMKDVCHFLQSQKIPTIIISDSNSYFIDHLLERDSLQNAFCGTYTNPAVWCSNGRLNVKHHHEHYCNQCPQNLCKRKVVNKHLAEQNLSYEHIVYIGDGHGDLCPCLALKKGDYILARKGYKLLKCLQGENQSEAKAEVVPWENGFDVLKMFQKLCET